MRDDLAFALTRLRLGQPQSLYSTAEERTAAIIQFQRSSEKKKTEMAPQSLRVLRLYKVQLAYGLGDRYWELWKAHLDAVDADGEARMVETVQLWKKLSDGGARRTFRLASELALEHEAVGGDKGALFGFVCNEACKLVGKDDVYSVNGDPHKLVAAMVAVQQLSRDAASTSRPPPPPPHSTRQLLHVHLLKVCTYDSCNTAR